MKINKLDLEKILVKNWTQFIDPRQIFVVLQEITTTLSPLYISINNVKITRFEFTPQGYIIWFEYIIKESTCIVNAVSEFLLKTDELEHIESYALR